MNPGDLLQVRSNVSDQSTPRNLSPTKAWFVCDRGKARLGLGRERGEGGHEISHSLVSRDLCGAAESSIAT